jgi:phosphoserine phosphatase
MSEGDLMRIIIFDVDNTLVKGNLTFFFIKFLALEKIRFFYKCLPIFLHAVILVFRTLPRIITRTKNLKKLDRSIGYAIADFYKKLFSTFKALKLTGTRLEKKASTFFSDDFFKKHLYVEGLEKIEHHLKNKKNMVVLLSGSPQELLNILFKRICAHLDEKDIPYENRFFARGTTRRQPCVGSKKIDALKALLQKAGHNEYVIQFVYSDNNFMADLPLLLASEHGGALISEKHQAYKLLPKRLLKNAVFLPFWKRVI